MCFLALDWSHFCRILCWRYAYIYVCWQTIISDTIVLCMEVVVITLLHSSPAAYSPLLLQWKCDFMYIVLFHCVSPHHGIEYITPDCL